MPQPDTEHAPAVTDGNPRLSNFQIASFVVLGITLLICAIVAWTTRNAMTHLASAHRTGQSGGQNALVEPWQTAVDLASLAVTAEEQQNAHIALALADHEVHEAFQAALDQAQIDVHKRSKNAEAVRLAKVMDQHQQTVNQDQEALKTLGQSAADNADTTDLDLAKAQLDLDVDELKDAQQTLSDYLGDARGQLEQDLTTHEAAVKKYNADNAARSLSAVATSQHYGTVAKRLTAWMDQRARYQAILQAADQTDKAAAQSSNVQNQKFTNTQANTAEDKISRMDAMKRASMHKRIAMIRSDQAQTQKQLADVYRKWAAQVELQHGIVFHLLAKSCLYVLLVLLGGLALDALVGHFLRKTSIATAKLGRQQYSVRVLLRLCIQIVGAVLIFLFVFGPPSELSTVLGLTTAGLTVVLQDFIISFCGWFVLMGKHGFRVHDWVEIDGIAGEVVDIGIFRTALLETGNWTDKGHPTGRRITFPNSFAIKGQYFNFTTSGQWMWDELTVTVPAADAYGTVELIHKVVMEETDAESLLAEDEWKHSGRKNGLSMLSAQASVNMRPAPGGIDIVTRYVTRASERSKVRSILCQRVLELIHQPPEHVV